MPSIGSLPVKMPPSAKPLLKAGAAVGVPKDGPGMAPPAGAAVGAAGATAVGICGGRANWAGCPNCVASEGWAAWGNWAAWENWPAWENWENWAAWEDW